MKHYLKTFGFTALILVVVYIYLLSTGQVIGLNKTDFTIQHIKFIEYLREYILNTHDLLPQISYNYGLGQSFVTLYYHGMYNPFIMLSLLLGSLEIDKVMLFIYTLILIGTSLSMHLLARLNKFSHTQARVVSLLTTFSGGLLFHLSCHVMYIYYFPFMIIGLISLHYLITSKRKYLFPLMVGMIFYTNFFFAPTISIIYFLYYLGLLIDKGQLKLNKMVSFFKYYLIGVLSGSLILVPTVFFVLQNPRSTSPLSDPKLLNDFHQVMIDIVHHQYILGIGVIGLLTIIYSLMNSKMSTKLPMIFLMMFIVFEHVTYLLNLNMYNDFKHVIYFIPVIMLVFGEFLFQEKGKKKTLISIAVSAILLLSTVSILYLDKLIYIIELIIIYNFAQYKNNKVAGSIILTIWLLITISNCLFVMPEEDFKKAKVSSESKVITNDGEYTPYRSLEPSINELKNLQSFNPNIYTSLENSNYGEFLNDDLEIEKAKPVRYFDDTIFDNRFMRTYLGITGNGDKVYPMVYGVSDTDVYNISQLDKIDKREKVMVMNQGIFMSGGSNNFTNKIVPTKQYTSKKQFTAADLDKLKSVELPDEINKKGTLLISFNTKLPEESHEGELITINGHVNRVMRNDFYGENENEDITFLIDTENKKNKLSISTKIDENAGEPFVYSNLKVKFYEDTQFDNVMFDFYKPKQFNVIPGHQISFNINQEANGYLATTIPYDSGFKVYVDGKLTDNEQINNRFLGVKLKKGEHQISIVYQINGFKLGIMLTGLSGLIIAKIGHKDLKNKKKNKGNNN